MVQDLRQKLLWLWIILWSLDFVTTSIAWNMGATETIWISRVVLENFGIVGFFFLKLITVAVIYVALQYLFRRKEAVLSHTITYIVLLAINLAVLVYVIANTLVISVLAKIV